MYPMNEVVVEINFDESQQQAINACCDISKRIVAVSGEAGTGKTLIIKEVYNQLVAAGYSVACSAPTGKAAKRVQESTGISCMTNHRLLGYGMPIEYDETDEKTGEKSVVRVSTGPKYKSNNQLPFDFILCDEYAMVNNEIHRALVGALKPGARIRMFGDVNQLRPIETDKRIAAEPSAFQTALTKFTGIKLLVNHRQLNGSGIVAAANRILQGRIPTKADDFLLFYSDDPVQQLIKYVDDSLLIGEDYSAIDYQIITCMNKSWIGTKKLNTTIQSLFWDSLAPYVDLPRHKWDGEQPDIRVQVGSKVVYTANTYDLGNEQSVFNGEIGIVLAIDDNEGMIEIDFGDRVCSIPPLLMNVDDHGNVKEQDPRKNIDLAYVLTTHKMQGSEVSGVIYILNASTIYGQSKRNAYTATSRARRKCAWITDQKSMVKSTKWDG